MRVEKEGVDIGVDTSSAANRTTAKQRERVNACKKRANRAKCLSRRNIKARKLALTAVKPSQVYGQTAIGMSPSMVNRCKHNVTEATGLAGASACSTSILAWAFRKRGANAAHPDPRVAIPTDQIRAWTKIVYTAMISM